MWKQLVERNAGLFKETKNPLYAWRAIEHALMLRTHPHFKDCRIPDEVLLYLRNAAHSLIRVAQNPPPPAQRPIAVTKALGLHKTGAGQGSAFTDFSKRLKDRELALETAKKIKEFGPDKADYAFEEVAEERKKSKSTVRRNYLSHLEKWRLLAKELIESGAVSYNDEGKAIFKVRIQGTADDFREYAEILEIVKEITCTK